MNNQLPHLEFFFRDKLNLLTNSPEMFPATGHSIRRSKEIHFEQADKEPMTAAKIREMDRGLDEIIRAFLPPKEIKRLAAILKSKHGFSSLSKTGEQTAKKTLRAQRIGGDEEAQTIRDFILTGEYAEQTLGHVKVRELEKLLADFEKKKTGG